MRRKILAILALVMCAAMLLAACNVKTQDEVTGGGSSAAAGGSSTGAGTGTGSQGQQSAEPVTITLLTQSANEKIANIVRDQLTKAGFNVELNTQADGSSTREQKINGNFDIDIAAWATVTGNPDYAVRALFHSQGNYNLQGVNDPTIDDYIDTAAAQTAEAYQQTYADFEKYLVEEQAYIVPLYAMKDARAYNSTVVKEGTVDMMYSWARIDYVDASQRDTRPLIFQQTGNSFSTFDPIRANDMSIGNTANNLYVNLVNLTPEFTITTKDSLSRNYAVADGNTEYYFILRDDIHFTRISDGHAVDSGVLVAGEDVVYSVNRMKDPNSVPLHQTYSMFESIDSVELVTDLSELEGKTTSGSSDSVLDTLSNGLPAPVAALTDSRAEVDNDAGVYQVVKVTTSRPFPQVLNYLAHHSGGIVDSEWVEAINSQVDFENYDATTDRLYGDSARTIEGSNYDNDLSCSGPYIVTYMNDYELVVERNPAFMTDEPDGPAYIKTVDVKLITDAESALSALRSGEIDVMPNDIPDSKFEIIENDPNLTMITRPGLRTFYLSFNLKGNSICSDVDLRKAICAAINQDEIMAAFNNNAGPVYSTLSAVMDCGNTLTYTAGKSQEYLDAYQSKQQ